MNHWLQETLPEATYLVPSTVGWISPRNRRRQWMSASVLLKNRTGSKATVQFNAKLKNSRLVEGTGTVFWNYGCTKLPRVTKTWSPHMCTILLPYYAKFGVETKNQGLTNSTTLTVVSLSEENIPHGLGDVADTVSPESRITVVHVD